MEYLLFKVGWSSSTGEDGNREWAWKMCSEKQKIRKEELNEKNEGKRKKVAS